MTQTRLSEPLARRTDPATSHEAASVVSAGNEDLVTAIRRWVWSHGPATHDEIANALEGERWTHGTVVTGCARADLSLVATDFNKRGRKVGVYGVMTETLPGL